MKIDHEELATLVPHKGKMFIIDRITQAQANDWIIESETKITPDFMFYDKNLGAVPNYACFEIIAQTVSALTGLYARENNLPPNMGFILSVSNLHFDFDSLADGDLVRAKAEREAVVDNVYSFKAELFVNGKEAGGGKLTVMEVTE
ncbi:hypothetical protein [Treponema sp. UBA3813]|uniref:ApeP family dehydratase n=1 Tax=Treponema sp. UBA3813 TaxID=1947715 RepID=UPI0025D9EA04|nr:hypothetical protein [Treponema sp. UBA3813]